MRSGKTASGRGAKAAAGAGRARADRPALSRDQIVEAALKLIDMRGLDALNMRDVARELGVYHRAIYWHFPAGKNALLGAVAAVAFEDVLPRDIGTDDWERWLRELFRRYRTSLRRHPHVAPLLGAQIVSNAGVDVVLVERLLQALGAAGFRGESLIAAYNAVIAAMLGYVTLELAPAPEGDPEWEQEFESSIRALSADTYPTLVASRDRMINRSFILRWKSGVDVPLDSGFDLYVEAVIVGLRAQAAVQAET